MTSGGGGKITSPQSRLVNTNDVQEMGPTCGQEVEFFDRRDIVLEATVLCIRIQLCIVHSRSNQRIDVCQELFLMDKFTRDSENRLPSLKIPLSMISRARERA